MSTRLFTYIGIAFFFLGGCRGEAPSQHKALITVAHGVSVAAQTSLDLDPLDVREYRRVSFFALFDDGKRQRELAMYVPQVRVAFAAAARKYGDFAPKLYAGACSMYLGTAGAQCISAAGQRDDGVFTVAGPFLLLQLDNPSSAPGIFTVEVYLTK